MSVQNILTVYRYADDSDKVEGTTWYASARLECIKLAEQYEIDPQRVVWATAAMSPCMRWDLNLLATQAVIERRPTVPNATKANVAKACRIIFDGDLEALRGPKVENFARCMWGDPDAVAVDMWAWRLATGADLGAKIPKLVGKRYDTIANQYRIAGCCVGLKPAEIQAITWVTFRRNHKLITLDKDV